jgi:RecA/RadA recombinase
LKMLDELLSPLPSYEAPESTQQSRTAGIPRGHVTEIYGPPGVGKTAVT